MPKTKLQKLDSGTSTSILTDLLKDQPNLECQYIESSPSIINRVTYFIDKKNKRLIFATPLDVDQVSPCLLALQKKLAGERLDDYSLVLSMIGNGITERHIVTLYKPKGIKKEAFVIDSKTSDPNFFFQSISSQKPGFSQNPHSALSRAFRAIKGVFRALIPNYQNTLPVENFYFNSVQYLSTGHQSYFDGISCGYHTLSTMLKLMIIESEGLLSPKETLTPKKLRSLLDSASNHTLIREKLPNALANKNRIPHSHDYPVSTWNSAVFHRVKEPTREEQKTSLFVLRPLQLSLNLAVTLPINLLTTTLQSWQNKVFLDETKTSITQYIRSAFLLMTHALLGLSNTLSFITTQLSSILTPFEPELKTRESEPRTKNIPAQREEENSFVFVDPEEGKEDSSVDSFVFVDPQEGKEDSSVDSFVFVDPEDGKEDNSINSFVFVDPQENHLIKETSENKQNSTNPSSGNLVFWKLLLADSLLEEGSRNQAMNACKNPILPVVRTH